MVIFFHGLLILRPYSQSILVSELIARWLWARGRCDLLFQCYIAGWTLIVGLTILRGINYVWIIKSSSGLRRSYGRRLVPWILILDTGMKLAAWHLILGVLPSHITGVLYRSGLIYQISINTWYICKVISFENTWMYWSFWGTHPRLWNQRVWPKLDKVSHRDSRPFCGGQSHFWAWQWNPIMMSTLNDNVTLQHNCVTFSCQVQASSVFCVWVSISIIQSQPASLTWHVEPNLKEIVHFTVFFTNPFSTYPKNSFHQRQNQKAMLIDLVTNIGVLGVQQM